MSVRGKTMRSRGIAVSDAGEPRLFSHIASYFCFFLIQLPEELLEVLCGRARRLSVNRPQPFTSCDCKRVGLIPSSPLREAPMAKGEGKNIVIYSDGTGQVGGIYFDEDRTNIYKLYRATRVGPDTDINPAEQISFYDPGLGSATDGGGLWTGLSRRIYNVVSQATGFGITANVIDCYAALIRLWKPGDRIFLFGFSRGAYTVRLLGGVIAFCGIPTHYPNGDRLRLDVRSTKKLASYAVKHIYQFATSRRAQDANWYQAFQLETRRRIAERFRREYRSGNPEDPSLANVYPYFIGVFDTVAALGSLPKTVMLALAYAVLAAPAALYIVNTIPVSVFESLPFMNWMAPYWNWLNVYCVMIVGAALYSIGAFLYTHVKWDFKVPDYPWWKQLATLHFTEVWLEFYDYNLSEEVVYAKHAISIDENRKDFARVKWGQRTTKYKTRDDHGNMRFEQVWFAGNHADIGGGYSEPESRLSDIALKWMLACATTIPHPLKFDKSVLRLHPDSSGMQHDEIKVGLPFSRWFSFLNWSYGRRVLAPEDKPPPKHTTLHYTVYERFNLDEPVLHYDVEKLYRPKTLAEHVDFAAAYPPQGSFQAEATCCAHKPELAFDAMMAPTSVVGGKKGLA